MIKVSPRGTRGDISKTGTGDGFEFGVVAQPRLLEFHDIGRSANDDGCPNRGSTRGIAVCGVNRVVAVDERQVVKVFHYVVPEGRGGGEGRRLQAI